MEKIHRLYNIANTITICRIIAIPFPILLLCYSPKYPDFKKVAIALLILMQLSDIIDGLVARAASKKCSEKNYVGIALDPLADKLYINSTYITITCVYNFPFWVTFIIVFRDILLVALWLLGAIIVGIKDMGANILGKITGTCQAFLIFIFLLEFPWGIICWGWRITIFFTVISGIVYISQGFQRAIKTMTKSFKI